MSDLQYRLIPNALILEPLLGICMSQGEKETRKTHEQFIWIGSIHMTAHISVGSSILFAHLVINNSEKGFVMETHVLCMDMIYVACIDRG